MTHDELNAIADMNRTAGATLAERQCRPEPPHACSRCVSLEIALEVERLHVAQRDAEMRCMIQVMREMAGELEKRLPRDEKRWADAREAVEAQRDAFAEQTALDKRDAAAENTPDIREARDK